MLDCLYLGQVNLKTGIFSFIQNLYFSLNLLQLNVLLLEFVPYFLKMKKLYIIINIFFPRKIYLQ